MNVLEFLFVGALIWILILKKECHWEYYLLVNSKALSTDLSKAFKGLETNEGGTAAIVFFLKFVSPVFFSEFLDTRNDQTAENLKKRVYLLLLLWWVVALGFLISHFWSSAIN